MSEKNLNNNNKNYSSISHRGRKSNLTRYSDVPTYLKDFLINMETIKGQSKTTVREYYYDLRTFLRFLIYKDNTDLEFEEINANLVDITLVEKVTLTDLYEYMAYVNQDRSNTASSRARKVSSLRSFYKYLTTKMHYFENDPTLNLDSPKIGKRQPIYLDLSGSEALLNSAYDSNPRDYCILTLLLNCGMRVSELVGINISDIRKDTLTVIGKGNKQRTVYLNSSCISALNKYLEYRPHEGVHDRDALFLNHNKYRLGVRGVQLIIKKYLKLAGLDDKKYTTHKLRHTAATLMYKYGNVDVLALQQILGHESIATTQIYTHTDDQQLKRAVDSNPLADFDKK